MGGYPLALLQGHQQIGQRDNDNFLMITNKRFTVWLSASFDLTNAQHRATCNGSGLRDQRHVGLYRFLSIFSTKGES